MSLVPTLKYAWLTLKHKAFVFAAGLKIKVPIRRLLLHDLSKLSPFELPRYGRQFFGDADDPQGFIECWIHHQNRNDHHWEYWIPRTGHNRCTPPYRDGAPVPMPEDAVREMVADWMGASRAYEGKWPGVNGWPWYKKNFHKIRVHPDTREKIREILVEQGIPIAYDDPRDIFDELFYVRNPHKEVFHTTHRGWAVTKCGVTITLEMKISEGKPLEGRLCKNCKKLGGWNS